MICEGCKSAITVAPVLVPKAPKGALAFCGRGRCKHLANTRAARVWPVLSGRRGSRGRRR